MYAIRDEMDPMARNNALELIYFPPQHKSKGNKWVSKIKYLTNGLIDKLKVHLVAKGFTHIEGIDYEEIFSHMVRFVSIHLFLALVPHLYLDLFQMDAKTAFLNSNLEEEINMEHSIGFVAKGRHKICVHNFLARPVGHLYLSSLFSNYNYKSL